MPDDYSKLVPPLPIPNRTVKRLCADDSAATSVKVGHRQASYKAKPSQKCEGFLRCATAFACPGRAGGRRPLDCLKGQFSRPLCAVNLIFLWRGAMDPSASRADVSIGNQPATQRNSRRY
jgi:hypothetical protein